MNKKTIGYLGVALLSSSLILSSQVLAAPSIKTWTNTTLTNWDKPAGGKFTAEKINSNTAYNQLDFWWAPSQVTYMQDSMTRNLPTFDFRDNGKSALTSGGGASTNLPDPKFDFEDDNGDGKTDEIEVVSRGKADIVGFADYQFYASWTRSGTSNPYMIAYSSMSARPIWFGGDYNTIPGSADSLAGHYWNDLSTMSFRSAAPLTTLEQKQQLSSQIEEQLQASTKQLQSDLSYTSEQDRRAGAAYMSLESTNDIDQYVQKANETLESIPNEQLTEFAVTFNAPISFDEVNIVAEKYDVNTSTFYARAFDNNGQKFTIALNGLNENTLDSILEQQNLQLAGFIEIEGKTSGAILNEIKLQESKVFSVEAAADDFQPSGLYWKLENTIQE